eukprot:scpid105577/ scgid15780/ 
MMAASILYAAVLLSFAASAWGYASKANITAGTLLVFSCNGSTNGSAPAVMLFFKDIKYVTGNSSNISLATSGEPRSELVGCDTHTTANGTGLVASVTMNGSSSSSEKQNLTFDFHFRRTNGRLSPKTASSTNSSFYWELATIVAKDGSESTCFLPKDENDWVIAPRNFSFSCQPQRLW